MAGPTRFDELHREENIALWEWKEGTRNRIVAVPLDEDSDLRDNLRPTVGERMSYAFWASLFTLAVLAIPAVELFILFTFRHSPASAVPLIIVDMLVGIAAVLKIANVLNAKENPVGRTSLYSFPNSDSGNREATESLLSSINSYKAHMFASSRPSNPADIELSRLSQSDARFKYLMFFAARPGCDSYKSQIFKEGNLDAFLAEEMDPPERGEKVVPTRSTAATPRITKTRQLSKATPMNFIPVEDDPRAARVQLFYERLAKERGDLEQLPVAAKRWHRLDEVTRGNLELIMEELTPALEVVREAKALNREELLSSAETKLTENIAVAEEEAARINRTLDEADLSTITSSGIFLREKFSRSGSALDRELLHR